MAVPIFVFLSVFLLRVPGKFVLVSGYYHKREKNPLKKTTNCNDFLLLAAHNWAINTPIKLHEWQLPQFLFAFLPMAI